MGKEKIFFTEGNIWLKRKKLTGRKNLQGKRFWYKRLRWENLKERNNLVDTPFVVIGWFGFSRYEIIWYI